MVPSLPHSHCLVLSVTVASERVQKIKFSKIRFLIKEAKLVNASSKSIPELHQEVWGARKNKKLAASNAPLLRVNKEQAQLEIIAKENKPSVCSEKKSQSAIEES